MARDGWSRRNMMAIFFLGLGAATVAPLCQNELGARGRPCGDVLLATIYPPIVTVMLVARGNLDLGFFLERQH
jgi:hypothetical protein